jgi:queuine tRNA-ribosyltransferase
MPVGTRGVVKAVDSDDLRRVGAEMVLANTYHLMLRPGAARVAALGGLHRFMGWDGPILTDSGGFQIFSLEPHISEEGARFRSTYDGSAVDLTPEEAVRVQELLGPDIAMVLDVCVGLPAAKEVVEEAMERTLRWSERALGVHTRPDQALFGIVQGGTDPDLRARSAKATADLGFPGFGIGGLSVGEPPEERDLALEAAVAHLPPEKARYVMGLGDTSGMLAAITRGADLFDCVWPTRLARHGRVLTADADFSLRRAEFADDPAPLEEGCDCPTCRRGYSRAYLRHLLTTGELTALRLLTLHNLAYTLRLLQRARQAISAGELAELVGEVASRRSGA